MKQGLSGEDTFQWLYFGKINTTAALSTLSRKLPGIDENIFSANFHSVAIHPYRRILPNLASGHVVLPPVPRAGHDLSVHDTLAQRASPVQAGIVDGIELATDIGQSNGFALNLKLPDRSRGDLIGLCCSRKRHLLFSLLFRSDSVISVAFVLSAPASPTNFYFPFPIAVPVSAPPSLPF